MPASFHEEALKAQAVAARTFALSRKKGLYGSSEEHYGANVCTDPGHCQAWVSKEKFIERSGNADGWSKIEKAVKKTEGLVMTYAGRLINPLYHSNSGGVTEDVEEVWSVSGEVPYLKSVYSPDESKYSEFEKKTIFQLNDIRKKVKDKYPEAEFKGNPEKDIEITSYSSSGRVDEIRTGSVKMSGTEFRDLLSLRSTNLEIVFSDRNTVEIISRGYGHGVGMSQCGADALGKKGKSFKSILEYYYTGVNVEEAEK
jgi:stage II sporulation protein D